MAIGAEADLESGRIILTSDWSSKERVKGLPGSKWHTQDKYWSLPLSWQAACALRGEFGQDLHLGPALKSWGTEERRIRVDPANELRDRLQPLVPPREMRAWKGTGKFELFPHQQAGADFLFTAECALLADEMGTGKTATTLSAIRYMDEIGASPYPALVVCPNTVKRNWASEIELWLPGATAYVLAGSIIQRRRMLKMAAEDPRAVVITNIESVRSMSRLAGYGSIRLAKCRDCDREGDPDLPATRCEVHPKEFNDFGFRTCVLDEAHRCKDPKSKQTRAVWSTFHGPTVKYRWALTGTPIANHPGDLWSLMHAVAPQDYQTRSKFIERYAQISWNAYGMEIHGLLQDRKAEFFQFLNPRMRRVIKSQVLTHLPDKIYSTRTVELSPKQRKIYAELEKGATAQLESGDVLTVAHNLTLATRLLQLASSTCAIEYGEDPENYSDWKVVLTDPSSKIDELMSIMEELGGAQVAIAAEHRQLLDLVAARFDKARIKYAVVTGAVDERQRAENVRAFQAGEVQAMLFTFKAGGVGINLTAAGTLVRLQRSWSLVDHKQGEDRCHRPGSERHDQVHIIDIVAEDTIEQAQLEALSRKADNLEEINRDNEKDAK